MTAELLETLLNQNESETLDFKSAQYEFERVKPEQQSELLKDILAFANSWRQADAYILVGIDERRDARSVVVGTKGHLVNRNLQQFVNAKTNRPVSFSYSRISFEGKEVGVLHIPLQERPVFLNKDFGKLRANIVYIRRGDTTAEASPDEVLRMASAGALLHRGHPTLEIEYGDPKTRERWGQTPELSVVAFSVPPDSRLPDYVTGVGDGDYYVPILSTGNPALYRDTAHFVSEHFFLKAVAVAVDNTATSLAEDVRIKITIGGRAITVRSEDQMPDQPTSDRISARIARRITPSTTSVLRFGDTYEVSMRVGNVQPGTTVWVPDPFFIGARQDIVVPGTVQISANNLRIPVVFETRFSIRVESQKLSVTQVRDIAKSFIE